MADATTRATGTGPPGPQRGLEAPKQQIHREGQRSVVPLPQRTPPDYWPPGFGEGHIVSSLDLSERACTTRVFRRRRAVQSTVLARPIGLRPIRSAPASARAQGPTLPLRRRVPHGRADLFQVRGPEHVDPTPRHGRARPGLEEDERGADRNAWSAARSRRSPLRQLPLGRPRSGTPGRPRPWWAPLGRCSGATRGPTSDAQARNGVCWGAWSGPEKQLTSCQP